MRNDNRVEGACGQRHCGVALRVAARKRARNSGRIRCSLFYPSSQKFVFFFLIFFLIQVITDSDYHFLNSDARTFQIHGLHVLAMLKSNCG